MSPKLMLTSLEFIPLLHFIICIILENKLYGHKLTKQASSGERICNIPRSYRTICLLEFHKLGKRCLKKGGSMHSLRPSGCKWWKPNFNWQRGTHERYQRHTETWGQDAARITTLCPLSLSLPMLESLLPVQTGCLHMAENVAADISPGPYLIISPPYFFSSFSLKHSREDSSLAQFGSCDTPRQIYCGQVAKVYNIRS